MSVWNKKPFPDRKQFEKDYNNLTNKKCMEIYNVSEQVIRRWAKDLKIYKEKSFLPDRDEFNESYKTHTRKECSVKYNVSLEKIAKWIEKFNCQKLTGKFEKEKINIPNDIDDFIDFYSKNTIHSCSIKYNVSNYIIMRWAKELNISKNMFNFYVDESEFRKYYLNHTREECCKRYGVSSGTIYTLAKSFGLSKLNRIEWTESDIKLLKKIYPSSDYSINDILSLFPNIKRKTLVSFANILGLKRPTNEDLFPKELNENQMEIFAGTMLGDASLIKVLKDTNNSYYSFSQTKYHYEYTKYIHNVFLPFSLDLKHGKKIDPSYPDSNLEHFNFITVRHSIFTKAERDWYLRDEFGNYVYKILDNGRKQRIKIIPRDLVLTKKILSFWFFDDGTKNKRVILLCTDGFKKEDNEFLIYILKRDLGFINPRLTKSNRIQFSGKDFMIFVNIIKKYDMFECFRDKKMKNIQEIQEPFVMKNKSGYKYLSYSKSNNGWVVNISIDGDIIYLGTYTDKNISIEIAKKVRKMKEFYNINEKSKYYDIKNEFKKYAN